MGKQWKQWQTLFWGGSKITADGDGSHEIKRRLPLGRKAMTNLDSILKSTDITLPTKVRLVKAMVFPVVTYGCEESWVPKNWCFGTVVLERTLLEESLGLQGNQTNQLVLNIHWKEIFREYFRTWLSDWTDPVYCLCNFAFSRMSYRWNHTVIYILYINSAIVLLGIHPTDKRRYMQKTFCKRDWEKYSSVGATLWQNTVHS